MSLAVSRHPNNDCGLYYESLREIFKSLNESLKLTMLNNKGNEVILIGDININFLQYNKNDFTSDYLNMILEMGFMPLITKPTRITEHTATLIDHIYTNIPDKVITSGICVADITDHLPVFCTLANKLPKMKHTQFSRDFSHFNKDLSLNDIQNINFPELISVDVSDSINNKIETIQEITNKHAPICKLSNKKKKRKRKPLITNAILTAKKNKKKLFKTHYLTNEPSNTRK